MHRNHRNDGPHFKRLLDLPRRRFSAAKAVVCSRCTYNMQWAFNVALLFSCTVPSFCSHRLSLKRSTVQKQTAFKQHPKIDQCVFDLLRGPNWSAPCFTCIWPFFWNNLSTNTRTPSLVKHCHLVLCRTFSI